MNREKIFIIDKDLNQNPDLGGVYITIKDQSIETSTLPSLKKVLGNDNFDMFGWQEQHDGTNFRVVGALKDQLSATAYSQIVRILSEDENILEFEEFADLDVEDEDINKENELESYDSSWYWPLDKRLPRDKYKNPQPIKIAQADTGISLHPNVINGFKPEESMSFFFPPGHRKGQGVICWDGPIPGFMSHGTSTGGMMIGQPAGLLKLHGMTEIPGMDRQDVVELVPCRVADSIVLFRNDVSRLTDCINWAIDEGIKVVNISLGAVATDNDSYLFPLKQAIERAYKNGVIVCCASGQIVPGMVWPALYAMKGWSICCAPSNEKNQPSAQSIWPGFRNGYVTIAAPGENMPQASWKDGICTTKIPELIRSEGSSYSTAFTSSLAALWWALNYDTLSKMDKRDIVPLFRNTIVKACNPWNGDYPKEYGPGVLDPNKVLQPVKPLEDYSLECEGAANIKRAKGGTYKDVTLYAHDGGSIHVIDPIFVEGKLTLRSETGGTISMSGTIICRELEIICKDRAAIYSDDLEYYDSCKVDVSIASTCKLYIAAEGPMSGSVIGPDFWNGSTFIAWIYWRQGRKPVNVNKDTWSRVEIYHDWNGRWA
jgi:hypothetical protein